MRRSGACILDTNIVSDLIKRGRDSSVLVRMQEDPSVTAHLSVVVAAEIRYGLAKRGSTALTARAETVLGTLPLLAFDGPAARCYGEIRADLERRGCVIGGNDMLIAAQCIALGMTLITDNEDEFRRVSGLTVVNWLARATGAEPRS